jgi:hypothetical protein
MTNDAGKFEWLCSLLPADVNWGDSITTDMVGYIVRKANHTLQCQRDVAWGELREIREVIGADSSEATVDEVRKLLAHLKYAEAKVAHLTKLRGKLADANIHIDTGD